MRLLFDENLSARLVSLGATDWPESAHVESLAGRGASDEDIWALARRSGFVIVSKDDDFRNLALVRGRPPKVVWLQAGNASTAGVADILARNKSEMEAYCEDPFQSLLLLRGEGQHLL